LETPYEGRCACGCSEFTPEKAVLDTWATSSLTPFINAEKARELGEPDLMPMTMRTQAHEIIRTWAFYTIVKSLYHQGRIPWQDAMICGFVLAKPGEKISKSKGNAKLTPRTLIDEFSADAIRYWSAGAKLGTDTFFDQNDMKDTSQRLLTKLWNSSKFALSHLSDFDPAASRVTEPIDRWIVARLEATAEEARNLLNKYEIGLARKLIDDLFWKDFCDNYIEFVKERLYQPEVHGEAERRSAQSAIFYVLLNILKLYAIYVPHITEYIYLKGFKDFVGEPSIHRLTWVRGAEPEAGILEFGEEVKAAVAEVRKYKSEHSLSMKTEVDSMTITAASAHEGWFQATERDIRACTSAKEILYKYD
jgi:valyl-tRNA synthetase